MSEIRGNKGEWSELYVFLKVLAEGKLYGSDEFLNLNEDIFYNILKVIRTEKFNGTYDYNRSGAVICIVDMDKSFQLEIDVSEFIYYSNFLLKH
ncbi:TPA: HpaII family restriction endonuclease, partial [Enterococcus faecalis]|nr:HpaII family restriction endonuclease [Enterococcus faecalis]